MDGATLLVCASLFAIDGDSIMCDGVNMRDMGDGKPHVSGYDAPELGRAQCREERKKAIRAKKRMGELISSPGVRVWDSGERDRFNRPLVWVQMADGSTVGSILVHEKLARIWTNDYVANWCPPQKKSFRTWDGRFHNAEPSDLESGPPWTKLLSGGRE
ncbi:endonuclease YncB(thermonuclease family) [Labrenzia sp. EL_208]|nr:endonuclease YncB(thermonuclease family) [Labrenzia sp. EL_132]MBG6233345.1 endonuclease YncB(thermonuclease family) [Labrenzia sp. EL_208]